jgi:hypothetical protein
VFKSSILVASLLLVVTASLHAQEARLIRLPKEATSPQLTIKKGSLASSGRETNLGGWLVLNGARFANSEYPDLAKIVRENYSAQGLENTDPDFTQLPTQDIATDSHGRIVRGVAVCPLRSICGDLVGELVPFNLDASL